jgi:RNA polymerase sigma-70 factor (ECF subfamily)
MNPPDPDAGLVQRAQAGEFAAFEELVGRHEKRVFGVARRITGRAEDAEDVTQETFLSAMRGLAAFRGDSLFATWLSRIATNHALKILRKRRGLPTQPLAEERDDEPFRTPEFIAEWREGPEEAASRPETKELLDRAMEELDEKHRAVFVLRDVEGLSTEETAAALGITPANVKVRLLRARLALREKLTRSLGDEAKRLEPHRHE